MRTEEMVDDYLDCTGATRRFRLSVYAEGRFLQAIELRGADSIGLRFIMPIPLGEAPPWGEIRHRIRARLAEKHVVRDGAGTLHLLRALVRGQLTDGDDADCRAPCVIVDDLVVTWDQLGELLSSHIGFGIRVEIHEPGEE